MNQLKPDKINNLLPTIHECIRNGRYRDTVHAQLRKNQRGISLPDILQVLSTGHHEKRKDHFDETFKAWNYAIRGQTIDGEDMRVIVSFDEIEQLLIITAFYISKGT